MRYVPAVPLIGAMICFGYDWLQKGGFSAFDAGAILVLIYLFMIFENLWSDHRDAYIRRDSELKQVGRRLEQNVRRLARCQRSGFAALGALARPAPQPRIRVSSSAAREPGRPLTGPLAS